MKSFQTQQCLNFVSTFHKTINKKNSIASKLLQNNLDIVAERWTRNIFQPESNTQHMPTIQNYLRALKTLELEAIDLREHRSNLIKHTQLTITQKYNLELQNIITYTPPNPEKDPIKIPLQTQPLISFTDGSSNEGKGAGAVIITTDPITILQSRCKTSQSNSAAEETALELALQATEPQQELLIISDNQNTLKLITDNPEPKTSLQQNIQNLLLNRPNITTAHIYSHQQNKLEKDKHKWEPKIKAQEANFPINYTYARQANELVDHYAKQALEQPQHNIREIAHYLQNDTLVIKSEQNIIDQNPRSFIKKHTSKKIPALNTNFNKIKKSLTSKKHPNLKTHWIRTATNILPRANYLHKINPQKYTDPSCKACGYHKETLKHMMTDCPAYSKIRKETTQAISQLNHRKHTGLPIQPTALMMKGEFPQHKSTDKQTEKKIIKKHLILSLLIWEKRNTLTHHKTNR